MLITRDRPHGGEHWTEQLPRLLEPQGVRSYIATNGKEAIDIAGRFNVHAALIDIGTPVAPQGRTDRPRRTSLGPEPPGGVWILELFRRMPNPPVTIMVQDPAYSQRQLVQQLEAALRLGAFSVVNKPVAIEQILDIFRRMLERHYRGTWPTPPKPPPPAPPGTNGFPD